MEPDLIAEQNLSTLQPGDHLCCFYENDQQHAQILGQYLGDGLKLGQKVIYVYHEHSPEAIIRFVEETGVNCTAALERGQFVLVPSQEMYLRGGDFNPEMMLEIVNRAVDEATAQGYPALRSTGEASWIKQDGAGLRRLLEYESRINLIPSSSRAIILCQYHRLHTDPETLYDVLLTHPKVVIGTTVYDNFYYVPVKNAPAHERFSSRFDHWLNNLTHRRQIEWDTERARLEVSRQRLEAMVEERTAQLQHEIRERQLVEEVLRESEGRYRALVIQAPLSILVAQDNRYVFANPAIVHRLGYASAYDLVGKNIMDTISPESREMFVALQDNILRGETGDPVVTAFLCKDGGVYYSENTAVAIFYQGRPAMLVIGQDVTERLRYEQQLVSSLSEKEVMLREIHHRVKNNLNVIIALIDLQKAGQNDSHVLQVFKELQNRVYSMALVHENLFRSPNLASTDFASYLQSLTSYLYSGYGPGPETPGVPAIRLEVESDDVPLRVETAIPCGLIVNELMTNALKYAFPREYVVPAGSDRRISVRLRSAPGMDGSSDLAERSLILTVSDNGVGLPADLNWRATTTLGLQLVQVLARQLGAQIALESGPGVTWTLTFTERKQG